MFTKLLIANRGEIACRVIRTANRMGIRTVAVYSDADAHALHVEMADEAVHIGPPPAAESYLNAEKIIEAAKASGAEAIHPGYGFLSENPDFVEAVEGAGLFFVGPSAKSIRAMGLKDAAKRLMEKAGVPVVPGYHGEAQEVVVLAAKANEIGFPVLIKARAGGGGKGMRFVQSPGDFKDALAAAKREARSSFGDDRVLVEKFISSPRHIEVQVFGDDHGNVVHLFERDCSLQRRHQKVIEEAPAPGMTDEVRAAMTGAAVKAAKAIDYSGAGTIEFIADGSGPLRPDGFWFMEMNTRLQVEHPVTEAITGLDLVEWQLRVASGEKLPLSQDDIAMSGHAFEARLYAEDPAHGFLPQTGTLHHFSFSKSARNDAGIRSGDAVTPYYDPMIAKIITHAGTREEALAALGDALAQTHVAGTITNAAFLLALSRHGGFAAGDVDTGLIDRNIAVLTAAEPPAEHVIAMAALIALGIDPNAPMTGWRLWEDAGHTVRFLCSGEMIERRLCLHGDGSLTLEGGRDGVTMRDVARGGDRMSARAGAFGTRVEARVAEYADPAGRAVSVLADGRAHAFVLPDPLLAAAHHADEGDAILAPMTGVVRSVNVSAGAAVSKGDKLIVLEAMKMETSLAAPRGGMVSEVLCAEGDAVEGGSVLLRFEEAAE
ncbi:acetyl/propionyl/methylcrotonyl-CoA carboxylase subunit alpha [Oricola cellulosilytica]|uniref:Acetyl/propionyl/methylcrotonyl-CoA carboxylase subunit alpha n=1 Tax=Oricola cellulosilytica TaxID=1429082 RepID=A0A4R0PFU7_9HYPH|nr:acetyl/propionyl/methylcrotonyl-CoA carboxylase subunit alpha [Oricola cellulosilytica]TCD15479.1 acetyl/propionyl/methylcrotonyl-CoA carboxylase subunit alpha [Oricola cellulosilytica]